MKKRPDKKKGKGRPSPAPKPSAAGPPKEPAARLAKPKKPSARSAKPNKPSARSAKPSAASKAGSKQATPPSRAEASRASPKKAGSRPASTVQRIHFEDFDGHQFERLLFAYLWRTRAWRGLDWLGQVGSDEGRDIVGVTDEEPPRRVLVQAANRLKLTFEKVRRDLGAAIQCEGRAPDEFIVVSGHAVSAKLKQRISAHAESLGVATTETWAGVEFEERLRDEAEPLLARFVDGVVFPDTPDELAHLAHDDRGPSPQTITTGAGSTVAGRDMVTTINYHISPADMSDDEEDDGEVVPDAWTSQSEAVAEAGVPLRGILYARAPDGSRSAHLWRVGVFSPALQMPEVTEEREEAFTALVRRTFAENVAAELGPPNPELILVEHNAPGVSRVWGRWNGGAGMTAAIDETLSGSYRAQSMAALIARFLAMVPTLADRGKATVTLDFNPANRILLADGCVQSIGRTACKETNEETRREDVDLRDLGHVALQVTVRLIEPLLRLFHLVRVNVPRFTSEVAAVLNSPPLPSVTAEPPFPAQPASEPASVATINRQDALRILGSMSRIDVDFLRVAAQEMLAGRVLALLGGGAHRAGPLLSPSKGMVTAAAVHYQLARQLEGLLPDRIEETERRLRGADLIAAEYAPGPNYEAAGRPSRPGRVPVFSRVTPLGFRVVVAANEAAQDATRREMAYTLVEASLELDGALDGFLSAYQGIVQRLSRSVEVTGLADAYVGATYARIHMVDDATARDIDLIRDARDAIIAGRLASGLSPGLVRTVRAITESLRERHPRLALIAQPTASDRQPHRPALVLAVANFGQNSADGVAVTFETPGGFALGRAEPGGGWHQTPSLQSPRIGPIRVPAYDHTVVAELRRYQGTPIQETTIKWSLTGGGARPIAGELHVEPGALEPA